MHSAGLLSDLSGWTRTLAKASQDVTSRNRLTGAEHRHILRNLAAVVGGIDAGLRLYPALLGADLNSGGPGKHAAAARTATERATTSLMVARQQLTRVCTCCGGLYLGTSYIAVGHPVVRSATGAFKVTDQLARTGQMRPGSTAQQHLAAVGVTREILRDLKTCTSGLRDALTVLHEHVTAEIAKPLGTRPSAELERAWAETHAAMTASVGFLVTAESTLMSLEQAIGSARV